MDKDELKEIYSIINDVWQFIRLHADITDTDEYWDKVVSDADVVNDKHNDNKLCRAFLVACMQHLEWSARRKRKRERNDDTQNLHRLRT